MSSQGTTGLKGLRQLPAGFECYAQPVQYENIAANGVGYRSTPAIWDRWDTILGPKPSECINALGSDHSWLATLVDDKLKFLPILHPVTSEPLFRRKGNGAKSGTPAPSTPPKEPPPLPTGKEELNASPDVGACEPASVEPPEPPQDYLFSERVTWLGQ